MSDSALPSSESPSRGPSSAEPAIASTDATAEVPAVPVQSFDELELSAPVLASLQAVGFVKPTPIQAQFIPLALTGRDVMGQAQTGTGKTAAFLLPIFERIRPGRGHTQALILAPTRELAIQIHSEIVRIGTHLGFSSITLYGGSSYEPQIAALSQGVDIVVGTPGRVMDHMRSHRLVLDGIEIAVLDEADRMLDLGFRKDIEYILRHCPPERQTLLLSATIPDEILKLARRFMSDPLEVWTASENLTVDSIDQFFMICERDTKLPTLLKILDVEQPSLAIVFCGTKMGAKRLAERLQRVYISAREIHGDLQQKKREKIMGSFRSGKLRLLIATDVASRGIDVQDITHIINYDVPYKIEDYVHRIGRTGRMEKIGKAYTLVTREEAGYLTAIEQLINKEITLARYDDLTSRWWPVPPTEPPPDFEPAEPEPESAPVGSGRKRRRGGSCSEGRRGDGRRAETRHAHAHARVHAPAAAPVSAGESGSAGVYSPDDGTIAAQEPLGEAAGAPAQAAAGKKRRRRNRKLSQPVPITCSACGVEAMVNFEPKPGRPVYCEACYKRTRPASRAHTPSATAEQSVQFDAGSAGPSD